jgi:acyl-CoA thioesterase-1
MRSPASRFAVVLLLLAMFSMCGAAAAAARTAQILAFGDSLTAGFGLPPGESFPEQLERALHARGIDAHVVNAGASGDTTAGGLARLESRLADKPDLVILELGANDMLHGTDPEVVRTNLDQMIEKIKSSSAKLLLVGNQAIANWGKEYEEEFNRLYPELARAQDVALYPFFLEGVAMKPDLNQPDGLHPNARGVAIIVERIAPDVAALLGDKS